MYMRHKKIRGKKRKINHHLRHISQQLSLISEGTHYIYVPQVATVTDEHLDGSLKYQLLDETFRLVESISDAHRLYIIDERRLMNSHIKLSVTEELMILDFLKKTDGIKPLYIKQLEDKYNLEFDLYRHVQSISKEDLAPLDLEEHKNYQVMPSESDIISLEEKKPTLWLSLERINT